MISNRASPALLISSKRDNLGDTPFGFKSMHNLLELLANPRMVFVPAVPGALRSALLSAEAYTTLVLSKGCHELTEVLVVNVEGLSIISSEELHLDAPASTSIVGGLKFCGNGPMIHVKARAFNLGNVNLELAAENEHTGECCLLISEDSQATIEHCRVSAGLRLVGIEIAQRSKPKIKSCDVVGNKM